MIKNIDSQAVRYKLCKSLNNAIAVAKWRYLNTEVMEYDITLFYSAKSLQMVESCLQKYVNETITWFKSNKLAVNPSKSNSMLIGTR